MVSLLLDHPTAISLLLSFPFLCSALYLSIPLISPFSLALKITTEAQCQSLSYCFCSFLISFLHSYFTITTDFFFFFIHSLALRKEFISFQLIRLPKGQRKILEWVYVSAFGNSNESVTMVFRYRLVYSITLSNGYSSP